MLNYTKFATYQIPECVRPSFVSFSIDKISLFEYHYINSHTPRLFNLRSNDVNPFYAIIMPSLLVV
jgi:hypothetical protein